MKTIAESMHGTLCQLILTGIATLALAASAAAQQTVYGTGNPDLDVPAVQAAVDQGGEVILQGHFSFDRPPTVPTPFPAYPQAMVLVSRAVAISGARDEDAQMRDEDGERTTIEAGTIPFFVDAPGAAVTIQALRFVRPKAEPILVYAVSGLVIASCKIDGVEPDPNIGSTGIEIDTFGTPPSPTKPGHPENVAGTLLIVDNDIDVGGTASDQTIGVIVWGVGVPGAEVEAYISGNTIRNITERGMYLSRAVGRVFVEANVITTGTISGSPPIGILATNALDSHVLIAHNRVHAQWASGAASGIEVRNASVEWPTIGAVVVDNDVSMEAPEGTIFDDPRSEASGLRGGRVQDTVVLRNRIRGRARAALAVELGSGTGSAAANNAFILNRFDHFEPTLADISVGDGVMNTRIAGRGTVEDHGTGTVIVPLGRGEDKDKDHR